MTRTETDTRERGSAEPRTEPALVFIGGTGRSGTHVVARLLGRHSMLANVPNEARFHVDPGGFPDLLAGRTGPEEFVSRLRGRWWRGIALQRMSLKGLHRHLERQTLDLACERFLSSFAADPERACRELFVDLLGPIAAEESKPGLVEQSCDTIAQAPTLLRLFPEARFIHVVRDGRDTAASRVAQAKWLARPRTVRQGLDWWDGRMRRISAAMLAIPDEQRIAIGLDELIDLRRRATYRRLLRFLALEPEQGMRGFFRRQVSGGHGNVERWRRRLSAARQDEIDSAYREILDGFERDGINGIRILQRVHAAREG